jgi:hypothetical protein
MPLKQACSLGAVNKLQKLSAEGHCHGNREWRTGSTCPGLRTVARSLVAALIERKFAIRLSV